MKLFFTLLLFCWTYTGSIAQHTDSLPDLSRTDITLHKKFRADKVSIFGFKLGLSLKAAEQIWQTNTTLITKNDDLVTDGSTRFYVYDKKESGEPDHCLLYLIWNKGDTTLSQISFFGGMEKYLVGKTKALLSFDAVDKYSDLSKKFLGKPDKAEITLDVPDIHLKHKTFYYNKLGLEICEQNDEKDHLVVFAIVKPQ